MNSHVAASALFCSFFALSTGAYSAEDTSSIPPESPDASGVTMESETADDVIKIPLTADGKTDVAKALKVAQHNFDG